jgi:hypothetical protein
MELDVYDEYLTHEETVKKNEIQVSNNSIN